MQATRRDPAAPRRRAPALLLAAALLCAAAPAALAQGPAVPPPAPAFEGVPEPVKPGLPGLTNFTLPNGLEVLILPDRRAPVVTQMVYYKVGAADEPAGFSGVAHFLEHLMFKGTKTHPEGEFSAAVAAIGGQENAFTTADYTGYYQQVPADALEMVMRFEADRMENLVLTEEVVAPERDVVLQERRQRVDDEPQSRLSESVQATLFANSPYGTPVIGWESEIQALTKDDAIAFYDRYYTPNNAVLVIAGDVDPAEARRLAEEIYGPLKRRAEPPPRVRPAEPEPRTERSVTLRDPRVTEPSFSTTWLVPSERTAPGNEAAALDVLSDILGSGTTSRLYRALVVGQGIAAGAGAYYSGSPREEAQFGVYGMPRGEATLTQVQDAIDAEIERVIAEPVSAAELERAKNRVRKTMIYLADSQTAMARRYAAALATGRTVADVDQWPDRIEAVTSADVQAVARKYLRPERSVSAYLLPPAGEPETTTAPPATAGATPPPSPDTGTEDDAPAAHPESRT
ncbi:M16 family metallopeptidase [Antarcticirhabdus aurantiaca]|uniref:Pitrilysin family protein n=1 Tax=Antarcticirhabdus aurantiaca TaxID=2606717 RepID=A0ACD4NLJ8_9HYPH|nr:pitrilysin family protein [Antarcticirhabdus aurantiaca]WAJ27704.1 pitrilysin family protein [Jeongeuplla avenae]